MKDCFLCEAQDGLSQHHLFPAEFGGTLGDGKVLLCRRCHGLIDSNRPYTGDDAEVLEGLGSRALWLIVIRLHVLVLALRERERDEQKIIRMSLLH